MSEQLTTAPSTVPPSLAGIWERHHAGILGQVGVLEQAVVALMRDELDGARREEARREAHKLAGSLGTFGLAGASEQASELERLLDGTAALGPSSVPRLSELVVAVRDGVRDTPTAVPTFEDVPTVHETAPLLLIVEDDVPLAERLAPEASRRGMRVEIAASPAEARAIAARTRPDGVLLDLTFETGTADAYELLSELTGATPPVPVLVSTVRDTLTDRVEVVRRGGRGFVTKSLPPQQVIDQVTQLIEREHAPATTLLAVDDDPVVLDTVRTLLEPHGIRVVTLGDPLRFWNELDRRRPDVILLDVDMPGVSGIELCRVLRNETRWATVPVLVLTARRDPASIERIFAAGADDHLAKPVIERELLTRVRNRVERQTLHRALAETDNLTGVPNRHTSTQGLDRLLRLAARYEQPLALATLDLDRFKQVNDTHGHAAGDAVLRRFGTRLLETFRGEDVVGRWGGEEFVVGMYGMSGANAQQRLADLLAAFEREEFEGADGARFGVAFSAGVAQYPDDGAHLVALYQAADAMLYRAKAGGRGRVAVAAAVASPPAS
ncbi:MAG TPA: diguanylate cyclase [Conexibacter sp.]|jgi:diguanylate cyclase (GGDEF)-like protein|nr:diguanylate cyclase [Conexibacter sp.]